MRVIKEYFSGIPTLGVLSLATDLFGLFPHFVEERDLERYSRILDVPVKALNIGNSSLIGSLSVANSYGIVLPPLTSKEEIEILKGFLKENNIDVVVEKVEGKNTAFGNLIATNDRGCVISSEVRDCRKEIEDILNVEVVSRDVAGLSTVGSNLVVTNRGGLIHPNASDEEIEELKNIFKIDILERGTANKGNPSVGACIVANSRGAIVGGDTTGPEMLKIEEALDLIE
ncbi:MAG TPA: translation initiation factor IF-6 [Methanothermococcus okinawensis]|uniref:Translation initiation factor 6 n=1 Tax=Methanothermococcus okinawensis TaxID=155863 RepID=A0A833DZL7_9EURY|nr:translation initiation factor IF-6 [Methanothermococcus okinawensis]